MYIYERKNFINDQDNIHIDCLSRDPQNSTHTHEFAELIFIAAGSCTQVIDDICYRAAKGDLFLVNYGQTHAFCDGSDDLVYYNLLYVPAFFSQELMDSENIYEIFRISLFREFESEANDRAQQVCFRGEEYLQIKQLIEDMHQEYRQKQTGYRSVLNGYSRVLFSRILRKLQEENPAADSGSMERITAECLDFIHAHCFERITPRQIAAHTFYHPAYLSRVFKNCCGQSLDEYIRQVRLKEAARLLQETDLRILQILTQIGYTDRKLFYKHFRETWGMTPAQYRDSRKK